MIVQIHQFSVVVVVVVAVVVVVVMTYNTISDRYTHAAKQTIKSSSSSSSSSSIRLRGTWPPQLSDFTVHDIVVVKVVLLYMTVIV